MTRGKILKPDYRSDWMDNVSDSAVTPPMCTKPKKIMASGFREALAPFGEQLKDSHLERIDLER